MAKYSGELLIVAYNSGAWAADFVRSAETDGIADIVESTGASDAAKTYIFTVADGTAKLEFLQDTSNATIAAIFALGTSSTLVISPNGTTTGHNKASGTAIVTHLNIPTVFNQIAVLTVDLQFTGGITYANN